MATLEKHKIRVTESIPIIRPTVPGLLETFKEAFSGKNKPVRVLYSKGEDLIVERSLLATEPKETFLTPYQMIRQHSELEIQEIIRSPLVACCMAVQELRSQGFDLTCMVIDHLDSLKSWLPSEVDLSRLFGVEILLDPETPEDCLFFCGSQVSPMIRDIEKAICCRMV